jgi:hypothetical protein
MRSPRALLLVQLMMTIGKTLIKITLGQKTKRVLSSTEQLRPACSSDQPRFAAIVYCIPFLGWTYSGA